MSNYLAVIELMTESIDERDFWFVGVIRAYSEEDGFEVVEHLPHECEPERLCFKFKYKTEDSNHVLMKYIAYFSTISRKSFFYSYDPSDGYLRYETINKKGEFDKVWLRPDRIDKSAQYYRRRVKNAMAVYYNI